jgi:2-phosphoglycerate kinase
MQKYIKHLDKIHMIQKYIEGLAQERKIPIINNYSLDNTVSEVLQILFDRVREEFSKIRS